MLKDAKCLVFKVGTSSLTHSTGKTNIRHMANLVSVLSDLMNAGYRVVLVSSGAIGVGTGKLGLTERPRDTAGKQAAATVGQCELMYIYDQMFSQYGYKVGQLLITKEDVDDEKRRYNLTQAFARLFDYGVIPIINENDAVAIDEIVYGDNDILSAVVASLVDADALVILTETNGLYDADPRTNPQAKRIREIRKIDADIYALAEDTHTALGTGGMEAKIRAAEFAAERGIDTYIIQGDDAHKIYDLMEGADIGTHFYARR